MEKNKSETQSFAELNERLRDKLGGLNMTEISITSGVAYPTINYWFRGVDLNLKQFEKVARSQGYKIYFDLRLNLDDLKDE